MSRLKINPHGVSHNPSTLVARTINELHNAGRYQDARGLVDRFMGRDGTVRVNLSDGNMTEGEMFQELESIAPVSYRDVLAPLDLPTLDGWLPLADHLRLKFQSRVTPTSGFHVDLHRDEASGFIRDMESSGLWEWVGTSTVSRWNDLDECRHLAPLAGA